MRRLFEVHLTYLRNTAIDVRHAFRKSSSTTDRTFNAYHAPVCLFHYARGHVSGQVAVKAMYHWALYPPALNGVNWLSGIGWSSPLKTIGG